MAALTFARLLVATMPFERWRGSLGGQKGARRDASAAKRLAAHVDWAAGFLPFATQCLPRAMALSWMLRRRRIAHVLVFAARPERLRGSTDDLHAWVEIDGVRILGDIPGPWAEVLRLGGDLRPAEHRA
jgi:Transglutaminase-like superfamily